MVQEKKNRRKYFWTALVILLCQAAYSSSWHVFLPVIQSSTTWSRSEGLGPYRYHIFFYSLFIIVAGFWQDRRGPKFVGILGGVLLGASSIFSAVLWRNPWGLKLSFGVLGGIGAACLYMTSVPTCLKWFPDRRGLTVGVLLFGSGAGSFLVGFLTGPLLGDDPALFASTIPRTFIVLGIVYMVCIIGAARLYEVPPVGSNPEERGLSLAATTDANEVDNVEFAPGDMARTWQFFALWLIYFLGIGVGITAVGMAAPILKELAATTQVVSAGAALGLMGAAQGVGGMVWGASSDRIGRKAAIIGMFVGYVIACAILLRSTQSFSRGIAGLCLTGFCYGGFQTLMFSIAADYYGTRYLGINYGLLFIGFLISGFILPGYFARILSAGQTAGNAGAAYNSAFIVLAGMGLAGLALAIPLRSPVRRNAEKEPG